jgi:hypothetical protein
VPLFAALNYLSGKVISQAAPRNRHNEWLKFLRKLDSEIAESLSIYLSVENYSTDKHIPGPSLARVPSAFSSARHADQLYVDEDG